MSKRTRTNRDKFMQNTRNMLLRRGLPIRVLGPPARRKPKTTGELVTCSNCTWETIVAPGEASRTFWSHKCSGEPDSRKKTITAIKHAKQSKSLGTWQE